MGPHRKPGLEAAYVEALIRLENPSQMDIARELGVSFNAARAALRRLRRRGMVDHRYGIGWKLLRTYGTKDAR